jgi:hypothetical protein
VFAEAGRSNTNGPSDELAKAWLQPSFGNTGDSPADAQAISHSRTIDYLKKRQPPSSEREAM